MGKIKNTFLLRIASEVYHICLLFFYFMERYPPSTLTTTALNLHNHIQQQNGRADSIDGIGIVLDRRKQKLKLSFLPRSSKSLISNTTGSVSTNKPHLTVSHSKGSFKIKIPGLDQRNGFLICRTIEEYSYYWLSSIFNHKLPQKISVRFFFVKTSIKKIHALEKAFNTETSAFLNCPKLWNC